MNDTLPELQAIAEVIERGEDSYQGPHELLIEPEEAAPVNKSLYAQIATMTVGERLKLALRGNREARTLLLRDSNRLIQRFVLKNPRITDDEIVALAKNRNADSDLLREVGDHRIWPRNYQVRLGLVTNPKTPMSIALHLVNGLSERDLLFLAKSKNVSATVAAQARRLLTHRGRL